MRLRFDLRTVIIIASIILIVVSLYSVKKSKEGFQVTTVASGVNITGLHIYASMQEISTKFPPVIYSDFSKITDVANNTDIWMPNNIPNDTVVKLYFFEFATPILGVDITSDIVTGLQDASRAILGRENGIALVTGDGTAYPTVTTTTTVAAPTDTTVAAPTAPVDTTAAPVDTTAAATPTSTTVAPMDITATAVDTSSPAPTV